MNSASVMRVYSGRCCMCDVGRKTGEIDEYGNELFTGDVVQLWHGNWIGTDSEEWLPTGGLTAIVAEQYQSFTNGKVVETDPDATPFTMGIRGTGIQGGEWKVTLVKSHKMLVPGERFLDYGLNYREGAA